MSTTAPTQLCDDTERATRHIHVAREMGERALSLLRAASARAERDLASDTAAFAPAETAKPTPRKTHEASLLFTRLCHIVKTALDLESRLAKILNPATPKPRPDQTPAPSANAPLPPAATLSRTAAALASGTSLSSPVTLPWQTKPPAPHPAVSATPLPGLPQPNQNGTTPTPLAGQQPATHSP